MEEEQKSPEVESENEGLQMNKPLSIFILLAAFGFLAVLISGTGKNSNDDASPEVSGVSQEISFEEEIEDVDLDELENSEETVDTEMEKVEELIIEDTKVGDGAVATAGATVTVNYSGKFTDGTEFDNSYDRGEPFSFILGEKQVIEGWDEGLLGMKVGGKRVLTIPSDKAYGETGAGGVIPPNAVLIFEIELLGVE